MPVEGNVDGVGLQAEVQNRRALHGSEHARIDGHENLGRGRALVRLKHGHLAVVDELSIHVDLEVYRLAVARLQTNRLGGLSAVAKIELEEIESAINSLSYINESISLYGSQNQLNLIIAVASLCSKVEQKVILADLKTLLPTYMIPKQLYFEKHLPKNKNGKVDRKFLQDKYFD